MTFIHLIIIIAVLIAITIILTILSTRKTHAGKPSKVLSRITVGFIAASIIAMCGTVAFGALSLAHGMWTLNTTLDTAAHGIASTPTDQSDQLTDNPTSMLVYVYRFDCPDCQQIHEDIDAALADHPHICVSSRSTAGKALCDEVGVDEVPAVVAYNSNGDHLWQPVYYNDADGNAVFDKVMFNSLVSYSKDYLDLDINNEGAD